jgi:hypothetical protein
LGGYAAHGHHLRNDLRHGDVAVRDPHYHLRQGTVGVRRAAVQCGVLWELSSGVRGNPLRERERVRACGVSVGVIVRFLTGL